MGKLIFVTHPEVLVDANAPVTGWGLSTTGHEKAKRFASSDIVTDVKAIWSSEETKATETARHLTEKLGVPVQLNGDLGENDRSATGFLQPAVFEAAADAFFARPEQSFKGWERAVDAQTRISRAVRGIAGSHTDGDLAIVSHGAVGTLLYCALTGKAISRTYDQPSQGHYWVADLSDLVPRHGWRPFG